MASPESPDPREWRQMRNDVDDGNDLLRSVQDSVIRISSTQRLHSNRLNEIQQSVDLAAGRLDRMEDNQRRQGERLGRVEGRLDGIDGRLNRMEERQGQQDELLGRIEDSQGQQSERLGRMEKTQEQILDLLRGRPTG